MKLRKTSLLKIMRKTTDEWREGTVQEFLDVTDSEMLAIEARVLKVNLIKGDLIKLSKEGRFDYIVHGCNCYHTMGAGIAKAIKESFPEAFRADVENHELSEAEHQAGYWSMAPINRKLTVVNFYTQVKLGANFDINYLKKCCNSFYAHLVYDWNRRDDEDCILEIGFPWIGCGIGGGDKMEVLKVLADLNNGYGDDKICNVTIVEL